MKNRKGSIKKYFSKRKIFTILSIFIPSLLIILSGICRKKFDNEMSGIEVAYYVSQILATIFLIAGTVIAVWQYYIASKDSVRRLQLEQVQRAIDLSEYYKDNILGKYRAIHYVYMESGIQDIMDDIKISSMNRFDEKELNDLLTERQRKKLKSIQNSEKFVTAVIQANMIYNLGLKTKAEEIKTDDGKRRIEITVDSIPAFFMSDLNTELLNNMEYFAMHFRHNTADQSVVYRSLHQSYLQTVQGMYYSIAELNKVPESKYYTNVIWLYHKWYKKNRQEIEDGMKENHLDYGTNVK